MNLKQKVGTALVTAAAMLVVSAPAGATAPISGYLDAPERAGAATLRADAIVDWPILNAIRNSAGPAATGSDVDAAVRGTQVDGSTSLVVSEPTATTGFDWGDAAVGASTAAMLALLIGGTFVLVRHSRRRELAR